MFWIFVIAQALISAVFCGVIADSKNRDVIGWVVLGFFFGLFALIAAVGVAPLAEMQPQAGTTPKEVTPDTSNSFTGERDLSNDAYKLWLAAHYGIARNEVFNSFILEERIFPDLDEALAYAHSQEMAVIAAAEAAAIAKAEAEENERKLREQQMAEYALQEAERRRNFWRRDVWIITAISLVSIGILIAFIIYQVNRIELQEREREIRAQLSVNENLDNFEIPPYNDSNKHEVLNNALDSCYKWKDKNPTLVRFFSPVASEEIDYFYEKAALRAGYKKTPSLSGYFYTHPDGRVLRIQTLRVYDATEVSICLVENGSDPKT